MAENNGGDYGWGATIAGAEAGYDFDIDDFMEGENDADLEARLPTSSRPANGIPQPRSVASADNLVGAIDGLALDGPNAPRRSDFYAKTPFRQKTSETEGGAGGDGDGGGSPNPAPASDKDAWVTVLKDMIRESSCVLFSASLRSTRAAAPRRLCGC